MNEPISSPFATTTVADLLALAESGEKEQVWGFLHTLLRATMKDEPGEVLVFDEDGRNIICVVCSRSSHDALVNALMDAGPDGDPVNLEAVLGSSDD